METPKLCESACVIFSSPLISSGPSQPFPSCLPETPLIKTLLVHVRLRDGNEGTQSYLVSRGDPNCIFPIERMRELEQDGVIGEFADPAYSFTGGIFSARRVREELAPKLVEVLQERMTDVLYLVPA